MNHHEKRFSSIAPRSMTHSPPVAPLVPLPPVPLPLHTFVPNHSSPCAESVSRLIELLSNSRRLLVMTGAGISTESGIPDYRSEGVGLYARSTNRPIQYQDFVKSSRHRRRYWARNFVGWPRFGFHSPNSSHQTLANWEERDRVHWLITQNVDALHFKAGSRQVTELHGSAHRVICLKCHHVIQREEFQRKLEEANPDFLRSLFDDSEAAPDGDVQLTDEQVVDFVTPSCSRCGDGVLKPDIVFFGDNVASNVKEFCCQKLEESDCLLVVGSSLFVYSGYRFALKAKEAGIPLAILNIGETRADHLADVKVQGICSAVLRTVEDETLWNVAGT